jgi:hypothetical protein
MEKAEAVQMLIHCWENLSNHVFASAWKMYVGELDVWRLSEDEEE